MQLYPTPNTALFTSVVDTSSPVSDYDDNVMVVASNCTDRDQCFEET